MMEWTKIPPSRYGFYWVKFEDGGTDIVEVRESFIRDVFVVGTMGDTMWQPMNTFVGKNNYPSWYGPLEAPEEK